MQLYNAHWITCQDSFIFHDLATGIETPINDPGVRTLGPFHPGCSNGVLTVDDD